MPRVLPYSSTPSHLERSHFPATRAAWAWGMLRAWASSRAIACSAADRMLDWGALTTMMPRSVAAATERGIMVVNAPQSNILSAAEQAMALLLAQARNIPQAHAALVAGKWERSKWEGVELYGKTLGIVGLGRVGALVAQRALAFGMRLVAYDPFVSHNRAKHMGVE